MNGVFDDADDKLFGLTLGTFISPGFHYAVANNSLKLQIQSGNLPVGNYRFRFNNTGVNGLKNPFGVPLSGPTDHFFEISSGKGKTGDVITVDLKQTLGGTSFGLRRLKIQQ